MSVLTSRIVRIALEDTVRLAAPSYVGDRKWEPVPFTVHDAEPVRLVTPDLQVEIATSPLRLSFLDAAGDWLIREPADAGMPALHLLHLAADPDHSPLLDDHLSDP